MTTPTPDREALLALADRVEAATEYDGRLMAEIDCAVRFPHLRPAEPDDHRESVHCRDRTFDPSSIWTPTGWLMSRNYWRSVDDAMALIPSAYRIGVLMEYDAENRFAAKLFNRGGPGGLPAREAATAALAITAVSLRALAGDRP